MLAVILLACTTVLAGIVPKTACNPEIPGCATCTTTGSEQTCTSCATGGEKVRPDKKGCIPQCPPDVSTESGEFCECKSTHQPSPDGQTCVPKTGACNPEIPGCATCTTTGSEQTCTSCATGGEKVRPDKKGCIPQCPPDVSTESGEFCECKSTHQPSPDGQTCVPKTGACNPEIPGCATCTTTGSEQTCTSCATGGEKVRPDKKGCIPQCPPDVSTESGEFCECKSTHQPSPDGQTCVPKTGACNPEIPGCATCTTTGSEQTCTSCATGGEKVRPDKKGCIPQCPPDVSTESGEFCECKSTHQPSPDGQTCVPKTGACNPEIPGCATCTTTGSEQTCTSCATGGEKVRPDKKGCIPQCPPDVSTESGEFCECKSTHQPSPDGQTCVPKTGACNPEIPGCATCTTTGSEQTCTSCATGGEKVRPDKKGCIPQCPPDVSTESGEFCECKSTHQPSPDGQTCVPKTGACNPEIPGCATCTTTGSEQTCTSCATGGEKVRPDKKGCIPQCPPDVSTESGEFCECKSTHQPSPDGQTCVPKTGACNPEIPGCATCTTTGSEQTCTSCATGGEKVRPDKKGCIPQCPPDVSTESGEFCECKSTHQPSPDGQTCVPKTGACNPEIPGCATCTTTGSEQTCTSCATGGEKVRPDKKGCIPQCPPDVSTESGEFCECKSTHQPSPDGQTCVPKTGACNPEIPGCATCTTTGSEQTCTSCATGGEKVRPDKKGCIPQCPPDVSTESGEFCECKSTHQPSPDGQTCVPKTGACNPEIPGCATCTTTGSEQTCTSCATGGEKVRPDKKGCIPQCPPDVSTESGEFCECKSTHQPSPDGQTCVPKTGACNPEIPGCATCTTTGSEQTCTSCATGGEKVRPDKKGCIPQCPPDVSTESGEFCECKSTHQPSPDGQTCVPKTGACNPEIPGCATCTTTGSEQTCTSCATGGEKVRPDKKGCIPQCPPDVSTESGEFCECKSTHQPSPDGQTCVPKTGACNPEIPGCATCTTTGSEQTCTSCATGGEKVRPDKKGCIPQCPPDVSTESGEFCECKSTHQPSPDGQTCVPKTGACNPEIPGCATCTTTGSEQTCTSCATGGEKVRPDKKGCIPQCPPDVSTESGEFCECKSTHQPSPDGQTCVPKTGACNPEIPGCATCTTTGSEQTCTSCATGGEKVRPDKKGCIPQCPPDVSTESGEFCECKSTHQPSPDGQTCVPKTGACNPEIPGCATCTTTGSEQTCTSCATGGEKVRPDKKGCIPQCPPDVSTESGEFCECKSTHQPSPDGQTCVPKTGACNPEIPGCATCTTTGSEQTCTSCATGGEKVRPDKKGCIPQCPPDVSTESGEFCECKSTHQPSPDGQTCVPKTGACNPEIPGCATCTTTGSEQTCTSCATGGEKVRPDKKGCIPQCPPDVSTESGEFCECKSTHQPSPDGQTCVPKTGACNPEIPGCATCTTTGSEQTCTSCATGGEKVRPDKKGCIPQCPPDVSTESGEFCECKSTHQPSPDGQTCVPKTGACNPEIPGCATCTTTGSEQTCTSCATGGEKVRPDKKGCIPQCPPDVSTESGEFCECKSTHQPSPDGQTCVPKTGACNPEIPGCATCTTTGSEQTCTSCATGGEKVRPDKKGCIPQCPPDVSTESGEFCECKSTHQPSPDGQTCVPKTGACNPEIPGCATCTTTGSEQTCTSCATGGEKVRPDKKGCIPQCPPDVSTESGEFCECKSTHQPSPDGQTCVPKTGACNPEIPGCATCTTTGSEQTCTSCATGGEKVRPDKKGCIPQCPPDVSTESGEFCECKSTHQPSPDGQTCVPKTGACNPEIPGCATCTTTGSEQTCTSCATGGEKVRPDKKGCIPQCPPDVSTESGEFCECKSTHQPSPDGQTCVPKTGACNPEIPGCATCTTTGSEQTCTSCATGGEKVRPDKKGCIPQCPPDVSTESGEFCECKSTHQPSPDGQTCVPSNTNKSSGLSTGAIAGIAVAAVIVVGGLVGFLCWWFLCRGKA
ncbi:VSP [Giardia duodenalis]|uniref:VSP n=1 Tax=Giardia intestinalis (strain ATCC 50803 / WB clone C6) TaxID=184922 RepID=A0A644F5S0_GIAIC|nr:VSP [Giardia intestinalis]KAE8303742.1 VSP [Giardia intestinalis]